jgi:hypothetical protein
VARIDLSFSRRFASMALRSSPVRDSKFAFLGIALRLLIHSHVFSLPILLFSSSVFCFVCWSRLPSTCLRHYITHDCLHTPIVQSSKIVRIFGIHNFICPMGDLLASPLMRLTAKARHSLPDFSAGHSAIVAEHISFQTIPFFRYCFFSCRSDMHFGSVADIG